MLWTITQAVRGASLLFVLRTVAQVLFVDQVDPTHSLLRYMINWVTFLGGLVMAAASVVPNVRPVVIVGGGIHAGSVAYYLKELFGVSSIILEKADTGIAPAASGKSGGFLAREWGSGPTVSLHQKSFDLHVDLAKKLGISSYRPVDVLSVAVGGRKKSSGAGGVSWLDRAASSEPMEGAAAQVTPLELTEKLIAASGAEVRLGTSAVGATVENGQVTGLVLSDGSTIEADRVVVAAGPWSGVLLEDWFGVGCPMQGVWSSSMVFRDCKPVLKEFAALFCGEDANGCHVEFYPRPDGSLYLCGLGGSTYISGDELRLGGRCYNPASVTADASRVAAGLRTFRTISSLGDADPSVTQACMRPLLPDGLPIMGAVPGVKGAYVSAGHNCWGILWAPVSGYAMAELVVTGNAKVVDLSPFHVGRFMERLDKRGRRQGTTAVGEQW